MRLAFEKLESVLGIGVDRVMEVYPNIESMNEASFQKSNGLND